MINVLLVDDESNLLEVLSYQIGKLGFKVETATSVDSALQKLSENIFQIIITDMKMPDKDGFYFLDKLRSNKFAGRVIVLTAFSSIDTAVKAMQLGAETYITKPVNIIELSYLLKRCVKLVNMKDELSGLKRKNRGMLHFEDIISQDKMFLAELATAEKVAASDLPVLVKGESGTGKDLVARAIHYSSNRATKNFVSLNCATLSAELFASELFGHLKGSFTGALKDKVGLIELADEGTLFLDEIAELPGDLQAKLLRVLENGSYRRVGDSKERFINIRLISATNKNIASSVAEKGFREDLYYRINTVSIELPSLRERCVDIELLANKFLIESQGENKNLSFSVDFLHKLKKYRFPGNIRELQNIIRRAVVLEHGKKQITIIPNELSQKNELAVTQIDKGIENDSFLINFGDPFLDWDKIQQDLLVKAFHKNDGNIARTARYLKLPRHKIVYMLEKFGIKNN